MFRNREVRQFAVVFATVTATAVAAGFVIQPTAGIPALASAAALGTIFLVSTKARYKNIVRLSEQIDLMLHSSDHLFVDEANEGRLSILQSEITKTMPRIQEQSDALKREKEYLVESMAGIARQLRMPLTSINLILSLLESGPDEGERKAMIRETEELFVQMDWLLAPLLKLSRLDAGIVTLQRKKIDAHDLIGSVFHPFLISMDLHNITSQADVSKEIFIQDDPGWLSKAIQNILKNYLESADGDGKIMIAYGDNPLLTEITIHDSGAGSAKEDLPHLFDRFYRGEHAGATGYGIGLVLCKTIIIRQGGTIAVKNHPQDGAVLSIRFPK